MELSYSYTPSFNNHNNITLASPSRTADATLLSCDYCPFAPFQSYYDYYGFPNYADQFIQAAMSGQATAAVTPHGQFLFMSASLSSRAAAAVHGELVLTLWMEVQRQALQAHQYCLLRNDNSSTLSVQDGRHNWDMAVAFYTGSLEGRDGYRRGLLLHQLADDMCAAMKTCGLGSDETAHDGTGRSYVNTAILNIFRNGQRYFHDSDPLVTDSNNNDCHDMQSSVEELQQLLLVPLIQDVLVTTYKRSVATIDDKKEMDTYNARSVALAAAIVPLIHTNCDKDAASVLFDSLVSNDYNNNHKYDTMDNGRPDFGTVKYTLETQYSCLRVSCHHVGGYYNHETNQYMDGAEPCIDGLGHVGGIVPTASPSPKDPGESSVATPPLSVENNQTTTTAENNNQENDDNPDNMVKWVGLIGGVVGLSLVVYVVWDGVRRKQQGREMNPERFGNAPELLPRLNGDGHVDEEIVDFT